MGTPEDVAAEKYFTPPMPEEERIREIVAKTMYQISSEDRDTFIDEYKLDIRKSRTWEELPKSNKEYWRKRCGGILSIKGILIKSDDQSLPKGLTVRLNLPNMEHYIYGQEAMFEGGFVKCLPERGKG